MYKSKLAALIDKAVEDCITCGIGKARERISGEAVTVTAEWIHDGVDIAIGIFNGCMLHGSVVERIPKEYR